MLYTSLAVAALETMSGIHPVQLGKPGGYMGTRKAIESQTDQSFLAVRICRYRYGFGHAGDPVRHPIWPKSDRFSTGC